MPAILGYPMNLFLKMSVLQANFCWLGDVKEVIWKESVAGIKVMEVVRVDVISKKLLCCPIHQKPPNWPIMSGHNSSGKLPIKSGRRCTLLAGNISISLAGSFGLKVRLMRPWDLSV